MIFFGCDICRTYSACPFFNGPRIHPSLKILFHLSGHGSHLSTQHATVAPGRTRVKQEGIPQFKGFDLDPLKGPWPSVLPFKSGILTANEAAPSVQVAKSMEGAAEHHRRSLAARTAAFRDRYRTIHPGLPAAHPGLSGGPVPLDICP